MVDGPERGRTTKYTIRERDLMQRRKDVLTQRGKGLKGANDECSHAGPMAPSMTVCGLLALVDAMDRAGLFPS